MCVRWSRGGSRALGRCRSWGIEVGGGAEIAGFHGLHWSWETRRLLHSTCGATAGRYNQLGTLLLSIVINSIGHQPSWGNSLHHDVNLNPALLSVHLHGLCHLSHPAEPLLSPGIDCLPACSQVFGPLVRAHLKAAEEEDLLNERGLVSTQRWSEPLGVEA